MNKAYDRVNWTFFYLGFAVSLLPFLVDTICESMYFHCHISSRVKWGPSFQPSCGLRQGDSLSPYRFIMCMVVFSQLILRAE